MNKTIKIAIAAAFAMAVSAQAAAFGTWTIDDGEAGSVNSGGSWFGYDDSKETKDGGPGCTAIDFPEGSELEDLVTAPWQDKGGTITYSFKDNCEYAWPFAGFGFNWFKADGDTKYTIKDQNDDPTRGATGIKIKYKLEKTDGATGATGSIKRCVVEIGTIASMSANDSYAAKLSFADALAEGEIFNFADDFVQEGWGLDQGGVEMTYQEAIQNSEGIKFKCEAGAAKKVATIKLTLKEISFVGSTPILKAPSVVAGLSMLQNGRMVSMNVSKAASVQVINLQGTLVHTQTLTPESGNMNLSKLPVGVYMVRVPSLGYANKVILK
ncbi:MAG: T9SS type A sorting domain-containing protein [Fibromonadaceae bacterium]|nr:T9SS type A sorting domain-containing protein [Fibromonadaceae bacterium]